MLSPLLPGSVVAAPNTPNRATETAPRSAPTGAFTLQPLPRGGQSVEVPPQHVAGLPFAVLPMARYDNSGAPLQAKSKLDVAAMTGPMVDPLMMFQQLNTQTPAPGPIAAPQRSTDNYIPWGQSTYTWYTPVFAHNPLYFEQPNLERYGIGTYRWLQPAASSAHFFTSIGLMPYKVLTQHPRESVYTLASSVQAIALPIKDDRFSVSPASAKSSSTGTPAPATSKPLARKALAQLNQAAKPMKRLGRRVQIVARWR